MPSTYSKEELLAMDDNEYALAASRNFAKVVDQGNLDFRPEPKALPAPLPQSYAATEGAWLDSASGYDYTTPSGKLCLMRDLPVDELAAKGILDQLTRLPGVADVEIQKANGQPPTKDQPVDFAQVIDLVNIVVPMVVLKPEVLPIPADGEERVVGKVYVDSVPLTDRLAIMNHAAGGVVQFDNFRQ